MSPRNSFTVPSWSGAALLVAAAVTAMLPTLAHSRPVSRRALVDQAVLQSPADGVTVQWRVIAKEPEGVFRLYRGSWVSGLELIAEVPARRGTDIYKYVDPILVGTGCFYQLRYRGPGRQEAVLATVFCREAQAVPVTTSPTARFDPADARLSERLIGITPVESRLSETILRQLPWTLRPLVPPPEVPIARSRGL